MKTVTVQIGNSDDKLSQQEWAEFAEEIEAAIVLRDEQVHFSGASHGLKKWQNAAWVIVIREGRATSLQNDLVGIRQFYKQESVAWTEGDTQFI